MLGENLRQEDIEMGQKLGIPQHRALWQAYQSSVLCKTIFINGEIAAIWGCHGSILSKVGKPWLIMTPAVGDYPLRVAFRYRRELKDMLKCFSILEDWVDATNQKAIRLMRLLGFSLDKPVPIGKNGVMFIKATITG
jgi:hypothetical protein